MRKVIEKALRRLKHEPLAVIVAAIVLGLIYLAAHGREVPYALIAMTYLTCTALGVQVILRAWPRRRDGRR